MFVGEVDAASRRIWEINVAAHEYGMSLLKPGASCSEITHKINTFFEEHQVLQYRTFGYGHSFGVLSHYYGREAGLELRERQSDLDQALPDMAAGFGRDRQLQAGYQSVVRAGQLRPVDDIVADRMLGQIMDEFGDEMPGLLEHFGIIADREARVGEVSIVGLDHGAIPLRL
eukprot:gene68253-biopygen50183